MAGLVNPPTGQAQQDMDADIRLAEASISNIRHDLAGADFTTARVSSSLQSLDALPDGLEVSPNSVSVENELKQPNSHTAVLRWSLSDNTTRALFVKKVTAGALAHKPWPDRRRSLLYARCETRFYAEFAPTLNISTPKVAMIEDGSQALGDAQLGVGEGGPEPSASALATCGGIMTCS